MLIESHKNHIAELECQASAHTQAIDMLKSELQRSGLQLKLITKEHERNAETIEFYQERLQELEQSNLRLLKSPGTQQSFIDLPSASAFPAMNKSAMNVSLAHELLRTGLQRASMDLSMETTGEAMFAVPHNEVESSEQRGSRSLIKE